MPAGPHRIRISIFHQVFSAGVDRFNHERGDQHIAFWFVRWPDLDWNSGACDYTGRFEFVM